jgi:transcriptional regulator with XRE-family HTH domain
LKKTPVSRAESTRVNNRRRVMAISPPQREAPPQVLTAWAFLSLLVKFIRTVLLDCTIRKLSIHSGIHENLLSRYENGEVLPTPRNLDRILAVAGLLELKQPLLAEFDHLVSLLIPPPVDAEMLSETSTLSLEDFVRETKRSLWIQSHVRRPGEYRRPLRRNIVSTALVVRLVRRVILDCSVRELAQRTGISKSVLLRYEAGGVQRPKPENIDRLLSEAGVLYMKEDFFWAMDDVSSVLSRTPQPSKIFDLPPGDLEAVLAYGKRVMRETAEELFPGHAKTRDHLLEE